MTTALRQINSTIGGNNQDFQFFLLPNLISYLDDEITIRLPDQKRVTDIKWFSVYDLTLHDAFGDVYIPEEFEPPGPQVQEHRGDGEQTSGCWG